MLVGPGVQSIYEGSLRTVPLREVNDDVVKGVLDFGVVQGHFDGVFVFGA